MSGSNYQRTTFKDFMNRLNSGGYNTQRAALCAASRSVAFSKAERNKGHAAAKKYFEDKPVQSKKVKVVLIKKATNKAFEKEDPFCVTFAKTVHDGDASQLMLNFLRGAANSGMTLPDLIGAIEAV